MAVRETVEEMAERLAWRIEHSQYQNRRGPCIFDQVQPLDQES